MSLQVVDIFHLLPFSLDTIQTLLCYFLCIVLSNSSHFCKYDILSNIGKHTKKTISAWSLSLRIFSKIPYSSKCRLSQPPDWVNTREIRQRYPKPTDMNWKTIKTEKYTYQTRSSKICTSPSCFSFLFVLGLWDIWDWMFRIYSSFTLYCSLQRIQYYY